MSFISFEVDVPKILSITLNDKAVIRKMSARAAKLIKRRWSRGLDANGAPMPKAFYPEAGRKPMIRTGATRRQVKGTVRAKGSKGRLGKKRFKLATGSVWPRGNTTNKNGKKIQAAKAHAINAFTRDIAVLGLTPAENKEVGKVGNDELVRQGKRKELKLQVKNKKLKSK